MSRRVVFDTPGTYSWTPPPGVTKVTVELRGASSGDGHPGETIQRTIAVESLATYRLTVGDGGTVVFARDSTAPVTHSGSGSGGGGGGEGAQGGGGERRATPGRITITY